MSSRIRNQPNRSPSADLLTRQANGTFSIQYPKQEQGKVQKDAKIGGDGFEKRRAALTDVPTQALQKEFRRLNALSNELSRSGASDSKRYSDIQGDLQAILQTLQSRPNRDTFTPARGRGRPGGDGAIADDIG